MKYQFHRDSFKWNGKIFLLTERERASYKNGTQERKKQPSLLQFFQTNTLHDSHDRFFPPGRRWHVKRTDRGAELLFSSWLVRNQSCHRPSVTPDPVIRSVARRGFSSASFNLLRSSSSRALPISFPLLSDVLINNRSLSSRAISLSLQVSTTCCPLGRGRGKESVLLFPSSTRFPRMWVGFEAFRSLPSFHFYRSWIGLWPVFEVNREGNNRFDRYCIWKWRRESVCVVESILGLEDVFYGCVVN